jgi:predicted PurR-regulated permease PerM
MNRLISWLQSVLVRVILTLSMVGIAFLLSATLGYGNSFQAQAQPLTPEATQYQVNSKESPFRDDEQEKVNQLFEDNKQPQTAPETTQKIGDNLSTPAKSIKENIESIGDTVREKLNLDQPIYPGTKEFLNDVQDIAE